MLSTIPANGITLRHYPQDEQTLMISNFVVHGQRGIGTGRAVMQDFERHIPEQFKQIELRAKNEGARAFWEKCGYTLSPLGDISEDGYWMIKDISGVERDTRFHYLYTTSCEQMEALHKIKHLVHEPWAEHLAVSWIAMMKVCMTSNGSQRVSEYPGDEVFAQALKRNPTAACFLKDDPPVHMQYYMVLNTSNALRSIQHPSEQLLQYAAERDSNALHYIDNPSLEVQFLAAARPGLEEHFNSRAVANFGGTKVSDKVLNVLWPGLAAIVHTLDGLSDNEKWNHLGQLKLSPALSMQQPCGDLV